MKYYLLLFCMALSATGLHAEFLKTGPFTYQNTDNKKTRVIVVPTTEKSPGIFIVHGEEKMIQLFDLEKLSNETTKSVFFSYNKKIQKFDELYVGESVYKINGSMTLRFGEDALPRISLDQSSKNAYLSVISRKGKLAHSVLGFLGVLEVINLTGKDVLLFEANALNKNNQDVISEYVVDTAHKLTLDGTELPVEHVGIALEVKIPCEQQNAIIIPPQEEEFDRNDEEVLRTLASQYSEDSLSLENILPLKIEKRSYFGFDYAAGDIIQVSFMKKMMLDGKLARICVAEYTTRQETALPQGEKPSNISSSQ